MRRQPSIMVLAHHVIEQAPPAGQWVRKGGAVVLTISTGLPRVAVQNGSASKPNAQASKSRSAQYSAAVPSAPPTTPRARTAAPRTANPPRVQPPKRSRWKRRSAFVASETSAFSAVRLVPRIGPAVAVPGFPTGCTAFAIASTGKLLHNAGSGLVVPVTLIGHPGEVIYGLMYVTPASSGARHFNGVLVGNGSGHLIVSVNNGLFQAQNGSHARYATVAGAANRTPVEGSGPKAHAPQEPRSSAAIVAPTDGAARLRAARARLPMVAAVPSAGRSSFQSKGLRAAPSLRTVPAGTASSRPETRAPDFAVRRR